jgi:MFS family permease
MINAGIYTLLGFSSNIIGALLSDYFESKKSYMAKANICMIGNFLSIPLAAICCFTGNFWLAITAFALKILVSAGHFPPAVTMM